MPHSTVVVGVVAAVVRPRVGHLDVVQRTAAVDQHAMADDFGLVCARSSSPRCAIAPGRRRADRRRARSADSRRCPGGRRSRCARGRRALRPASPTSTHIARWPSARCVALPRRVDHFALDPVAPRHPQEQAAVVVLADRDVGLRLAAPDRGRAGMRRSSRASPSAAVSVSTALSALVEQVVDGLPAHLVSRRLAARSPTPAASNCAPRVVEVVAPVQPGESPVQAGLMRMVRRTCPRSARPRPSGGTMGWR